MWKASEVKQNFFTWLDYGEGRELDLPEFPRATLELSTVKYLGPRERLQYVVTIVAGIMRYEHRSGAY